MAKNPVLQARRLVSRELLVPVDAKPEDLPRAVVNLTHDCLVDLGEILGPHVVEQVKVVKLRHRGRATLQVMAIGVRLDFPPEAEAAVCQQPPAKPWYAN